MSDLIDRQAAIDEIKALYKWHDIVTEDRAIDHFKRLPSVEVEPVKRGKWIPLEEEIGLYECSICGHKILRAECNYCPNCGAKMSEGSEEC